MSPDVNINFGADSVGGDRTTVGNITDASGVSIGRQANAQVGHLEHGYSTIIEWLTNLERRLLHVEVHSRESKELIERLVHEKEQKAEDEVDKRGSNTTVMAIIMVVFFMLSLSLLAWLAFGGVPYAP